MNISEVIRKFADSESETLKSDSENLVPYYPAALEALKNKRDWLQDDNLKEKIFFRLRTIEPRNSEECLNIITIFQDIHRFNSDYRRLNFSPFDPKNELEELVIELRNNAIEIISGVVYVKDSEFPENQWDCLNKLHRFISKNNSHSPLTRFSFTGNKDLNSLLNFLKVNPNLVLLELISDNIDDQYLEKLTEYLPKIENFLIADSLLITTIPKQILNQVKILRIRNCEALKTIETNTLILTCSRCSNLETIKAPNATTVNSLTCNALRIIEAPSAITIDSSNCNNLIAIEAPSAITIDSSNCNNLIAIEAPNAKEINCKECTSLTRIHAPFADLECEGCTALTAITSNGKKINCTECLALITLQANEAIIINCTRCPNLKSVKAPFANNIFCYSCPVLETIEAPKLKFFNFSPCRSLLPKVKSDLSRAIYENHMYDLAIHPYKFDVILRDLNWQFQNFNIRDYIDFSLLQLILNINELTIPIEFSSEEEKTKVQLELNNYLIKLFDYVETNLKGIDINKFKTLKKFNNLQQEVQRIIWLIAIFGAFESKKETNNPVTDDAAYKTLYAINELSDPFLRGEATQSLFMLYEHNNDRYEIWNLINEKPHLILLSLFFAASNIDEKLIYQLLKCVNFRHYQNSEILNPIHEMTGLLLKSSSLSKEEKEKILKLILQLEPPKKARSSKETRAQSMIAFNEEKKVYLKNRKDQRIWVDACKDILLFGKEEYLKNIQTTEEILTIHKKICREFFGVKEELSTKFAKLFKSSRYPNALFIYASRLHSLGDNQNFFRDLLGKFVNSCLKGEFPNNRYDFKNNLHLQTIFQNKPSLLEKWKTPLKIPVEDILSSDQKPHQIASHIKIQNMMKMAIDNGHLKNKNELSQEFRTIIETENYDAIQKTIQTLTNSLPDSEIEIACLNVLDPSLTSNQRIKALKELDLKLPMNSELKNDINGMISALTPTNKLILVSVESAETWEDFLLMGTEVENSCQRIDGNPIFNQCLLSYILDGKNKVIIVKDSQGKIVARTVLRILLDNRNNPVLFMEEIYTKGPDPNLPVLIKKGCEEIAEKMELPLTTKVTSVYGGSSFGSLKALNGPAPKEYIDALSKMVNQEGFSIPETSLIFPKKIS